MSRAARRLGALLLLPWPLAFGGTAWARQEVAPDRPDITDSAQTIDPGGFQLESGVEYEHSRRGGSAAERRFWLQTTLRAGLIEDLELLVDAEPVVWLRNEREDLNRGDLTLGLKYRFFEPGEGEPWPSLAVRPLVKLPTADAPIGTERPDFALLLLLSQPLPWGFNLDVNAGLAAIGQRRPEGFLLQAIASASLSYALTRRFSPFVELFFQTKDERDGRELLGMTVGATYLLSESLAVDAAARTTLTGRGPDWAAVAGFSFRWGR
ncbi:MAG TPA: transporter [Methylomirabilota bacterium]|nr:transporter [Methylomirabilota bacterium]